MPTRTPPAKSPAESRTKQTTGNAVGLFEAGRKLIEESTSPTTPEPANVHPLRAPVGDLRHAPPYFEPADMTRTHELIVDAVTAMLTTGGNRDDVDNLIRSAMAHTRRRTFESFGAEEPQASEMVEKFIRSDLDDWRQDLVTFWRKNKRTEFPAPLEPKSITDRIRMNVREGLISRFDEFMGTSSPEEQHFLLEVFRNYSSRNNPAEVGDLEIFIAGSFEQEVGRDRCYVRVPERLVDQVQKYVDALRAVEAESNPPKHRCRLHPV